MKRIVHFALVLLIAGTALVSGCYGPQVLMERSDYAAAADSEVELRLKSEPPADVLVLFNEKHQQSGKVTRRGFYLFANEERLTDGKRPKFVPLDQAETHAIIPIFKVAPTDPRAIPGDIYAISAVPWAYSLASHGRIVAEFELPAYGDWLTAKKFFLFPVAAAADVLGVGAAAGVIGAMEGAKSSFSTTVR